MTTQTKPLFEERHLEALARSIAISFSDTKERGNCSDLRKLTVRGILPALMQNSHFDEDKFRKTANAELSGEDKIRGGI